MLNWIKTTECHYKILNHYGFVLRKIAQLKKPINVCIIVPKVHTNLKAAIVSLPNVSFSFTNNLHCCNVTNILKQISTYHC